MRNLNTQVSQKLRFIKRNIIFLLGMILDHLSHSSFLKNQKGKKTFFIDHKIVKNLKLDSVFPGVVACIFDEGLNIRLELLKSKAYYLSLNYPKIFRFLKYKRRCKSLWRNLAKEDDFRKLFYYRDIPIWNLVQGTLNRYFTDDFPKLMENFTFLSGIFKQINVKYIFLRHDLKKTERILVLFAKRKNITTSMLQHGILSETNGHVEPAVDKYFVWGKASIEWFRRFGNSNVEFEVVGNPEFDNILNKRPSLSKAELCRRLGLDVGKDIILFVPQQLTKFSSFWTDDIFYVMAKRVLSAMQQFPNKQLIIKADPYESVQPYREIIERYGFSNAAVIKDIDIYDVLLHSESLITLDSTVALEGMALDMPVIIFNITKREDRVPYVQSGAAIGVYNGDELLSVIQRVIHDKDILFKLKEGRKKFLQDYAYKIDGNSKQRIKELIKSYDK